MRTAVRLTLVAALAMTLSACKGDAGADGDSCTVVDNGDGTVTISCEDGTSVTVDDGADGDSCTLTDNGDGTKTITCGDTSVTVSDGTTCTVTDNGDGTKTITCNGESVVVTDGEDGQNGENGESGGGVEIWRKHGSDFLRGEELEADNKYLVDAVITDVDVDTESHVTVFFTVTTQGEDPVPVTDVQAQTSVSLTISQLVPGTTAEPISYWLPYIYRTQTVSGDTYPNPAGTVAYQATSESSTSSTMPGVLSNLGNGNYSYRSFTQMDNVTSPVAVTYEPTRTHRVSIMMGGHNGPTASAEYDFRPDGGTVTERRDLILTSTCKNCHGDEFHGHGGNRITVANCATCHVPSNWDPHGGESVDLKVMIHKIHAGGELPTVRGPDGNPWATADNGMYAIWGNQNTKHEWWKVGFPAVIENCTACHQGDPAQVPQVDNWKTKPSRAACGSCHDDIDFTETVQTDPSYHLGGAQTDDASCTVCHAPTKSIPIDTAHDWTVDHTWSNGSAADPRNQPEFTAEMTMSAPANGQFYENAEAPVVTLVLKRNGTPINHLITEGPAEGCEVASCPADADGLFATTNFFVHGPRAHRMPVLTTAARAEILSSTTGPWDLSAAGASLIVKVDTGTTITRDDDWGTQVPGLITVAVTAATGANLSAVTTAELVTWLNGNAAFAARAIAYNQGGKLGIRSRNLGPVHAIQLQASVVATQVFNGDLLPKTPPGTYTANKLAQRNPATLNDPKITWSAENIQYQLDPVTDLEAGTYVVFLELSQLGRVSATDYKTPTVAKLAFNVKTATDEPQVASNCDSCHQNGQGKGFVLDWSRHNKIFDETAVDQCGACHDYQPTNVPGQVGFPTNGSWTGGKPIAKRVHAVHFGSSLNYPLGTVDYSNGDPVTGRNWDITFPQDVRNCETCHPDGDSSGSWMTEPARLPCMGCHDADAAVTHMKLNTWDPTPADPWSGDEKESCKACHQ